MKTEIPLERAHRIVNHGPVVLVTSQAGDEAPNIMTVAWITPVSQAPPMVAVSIGNKSHSHRLISESGVFVVNVTPASLADKVVFCGRVSGRDVDKFQETGLTPVPATVVKTPLIDECTGHLECRVHQAVEAGDHTLFIGRVVKAWAEAELFQDVWRVDGQGGEGLHHLGGRAFAVSRETLIVEA